MTAPDLAAVVLAGVTPPAPTWFGMDAGRLWRHLWLLDEGEAVPLLTDLVGAAAEVRGAQGECADHADRAEAAEQRADEIDYQAEQASRAWERERRSLIERAARWRERAETAEATVRAVEALRIWTNEDGKRFAFADDLATALGLPLAAP